MKQRIISITLALAMIVVALGTTYAEKHMFGNPDLVEGVLWMTRIVGMMFIGIAWLVSRYLHHARVPWSKKMAHMNDEIIGRVRKRVKKKYAWEEIYPLLLIMTHPNQGTEIIIQHFETLACTPIPKNVWNEMKMLFRKELNERYRKMLAEKPLGFAKEDLRFIRSCLRYGGADMVDNVIAAVLAMRKKDGKYDRERAAKLKPFFSEILKLFIQDENNPNMQGGIHPLDLYSETRTRFMHSLARALRTIAENTGIPMERTWARILARAIAKEEALSKEVRGLFIRVVCPNEAPVEKKLIPQLA